MARMPFRTCAFPPERTSRARSRTTRTRSSPKVPPSPWERQGNSPSRRRAPTTSDLAWAYTGGAVNGAHAFPNLRLPAGTYVARAFANDTYALLAESPSFTVGTPGKFGEERV